MIQRIYIIILFLLLIIPVIIVIVENIKRHLTEERLYKYFQYAYRCGQETELFKKLTSEQYDTDYELFKKLKITKRIQQKCFKGYSTTSSCYSSFLEAVGQCIRKSPEAESKLRDLV